jgi:hypothetical protein
LYLYLPPRLPPRLLLAVRHQRRRPGRPRFTWSSLLVASCIYSHAQEALYSIVLSIPLVPFVPAVRPPLRGSWGITVVTMDCHLLCAAIQHARAESMQESM